MPFTEQNKPLLEAAASIDFQFMKNGMINYRKHSKKELGLYFIKMAVEKWGNRYGYSNVEYMDSKTKVTITCSAHGPFVQIPKDHLKGHGCSACACTRPPTKEEFIEKAISVHQNKYDYSSVQYSNSQRKIEIICPLHGSFWQTPSSHTMGRGCPKCAGKYSPTTEEFIEKARRVHLDKYDYSRVQYKSSREKIEIVCQLHGSFFQTPTDHLGFHGCPKCSGHNHNILYLLKCLETGWYKIGITTDNTKNRINQIGGNIQEVHHVILDDPRKYESILHKKYEKDREYNLCVREGNTEFFSLTEEQVKEVIAYMNEVSDEG